MLVMALTIISCRETPRDNPFDPVNSPVTIDIVSPADNSIFQLGQTISFRANASTDDIPSIEDAVFRWTSDRDGTLALENFFQIDSMSAGTHNITLDVSAGDLGRASKSITVVVEAAAALAVQIKEPPGDTTFLVGSGIVPRADEWLPADAERIAARSWTFGSDSGIDDQFIEEPDTVYWNVPGVYHLVYSVIDNLGRQGCRQCGSNSARTKSATAGIDNFSAGRYHSGARTKFDVRGNRCSGRCSDCKAKLGYSLRVAVWKTVKIPAHWPETRFFSILGSFLSFMEYGMLWVHQLSIRS